MAKDNKSIGDQDAIRRDRKRAQKQAAGKGKTGRNTQAVGEFVPLWQARKEVAANAQKKAYWEAQNKADGEKSLAELRRLGVAYLRPVISTGELAERDEVAYIVPTAEGESRRFVTQYAQSQFLRKTKNLKEACKATGKREFTWEYETNAEGNVIGFKVARSPATQRQAS